MLTTSPLELKTLLTAMADGIMSAVMNISKIMSVLFMVISLSRFGTQEIEAKPVFNTPSDPIRQLQY